jgi:hypothetical protein
MSIVARPMQLLRLLPGEKHRTLGIPRAGQRIGIYAILLGVALALFTIGPAVKMGFSVVDDHERVVWLGASDRLPLERVPTVLAMTELGEVFKTCPAGPCKIGRFRPVYYSEIALETALFGDWTAGDYALRILFFSGLLAAMAWAGMSALGPVAGGALTVFVASMPFWGFIWVWSLGTSEAVAVPGVALAIAGAVGLVRGWFDNAPRRLDGFFICLSAGALIAVGCKENFAALWGLSLVVLLAGLWKRRLGPLGWTIGGTFLALGGIVIACIAITYATAGRNGTDVYGLSVWDRLHSFWWHRAMALPYLVILGGLALVVQVRHGGSKRETFDPRLRMAGVIALLCGGYAVWESFFYGGFQDDYRYAFPGALIQPFALGLVFYVVNRLRTFESAAFHRLPRLSRLALAVIGTLLFVFWPGHDWSFPVRTYVAKRVEQSQQLAEDLSASAAIAAAHPDWPILVEGAKPWDDELVETLDVWLRRAGMKNELFLIAPMWPGSSVHDFNTVLASRLEALSHDGSVGQYMPIAELNHAGVARGQCFRLSIRGPTSDSCRLLPFRPSAYVG